MLYYLFDFLESLGVPGAGVFHYITFRASLAVVLSLIVATIIGRHIIDLLKRQLIGETVRDLGLEGQLQKKGTPTMGGIIIIFSILLPVLLLCRLDNVYVLLMLVTTLWVGALGFLDDYIKVFRKNKEGLPGRLKIVGQVGLGILVAASFYLSDEIVVRDPAAAPSAQTEQAATSLEQTDGDYVDTSTPAVVKAPITTVPFMKNHQFDYRSLFAWAGPLAEPIGWLFFALVAIFIITAVSNGANMTDGLDGLAAGTSSIIGSALVVFAYVSGHSEMSHYLGIMFIPNSAELVVFMSAFAGATIGFLWYNAFPAQVFMGDTGSLTIGGIIGVCAILIHVELLLPILCGIFLVESLSVIIQVSYFKWTKRRTGAGQRVFLMAPLHHHYQKKGLPEPKIVTRFWLVGIILALLTVVTLKIR